MKVEGTDLTPKMIDLLGGRTRTRTWDPLIKSQLLYQLSYAPGMPPRSPARAASCSKASSHCPGKGRNGSIRDGFRSSPRGAPPRRSRRGDPVAGTQCWALDSQHKRVHA